MKSQSCNQLRVLLVGGYPPPFGGIATHLASLVPGLKERGAEDVAVITFSNVDEVEKISGATVYRHNIKRHLFRLLNPLNWRLISRVIRDMMPAGVGARSLIGESLKAILVHRVAERHNSQVVNFYESNAHFEMVPLAHHWRRKRGIALTIFGEMYSSPEFMKSRQALVKKSMDLPAVVWASSDHCARSFKTMGIDRSVKTVYLGVDLANEDHSALRDKFRAEHKIKQDDVVILFMGRFVKDMGLDVLLQIMPELLNDAPHIKLILAGATGDLSTDASELMKRFPDQITIFQNFPFSIQQSLYSAADIVVAPSFCQRACMGLSIKEAMAAKLPVVATLSGGIPEAVVHNETGFLVPLDPKTQAADTSQFKEYLSALINNKELRLQMGMAGRKRAEVIFSVETTMNQIADIFMSVQEKVRLRQI
ncbi:glycosyltransferase family 4 protein [Legionella maioricensis]|uniref:Glycosyltransferase family 4 protein n=1 Tax=Legionella maioricensis TaxID=2896528 RepID=A0A9X2IAP1_9GAMM|nr:glycosyltransferase family 4 protein [Legionella maioricensis]MCL9683556.1 glycosyltransferase family 4 protein [Legionella maioricensis]MCL9686855.1 glycosyltransferase family 4 protein [Legionella maioricensis]